jgi:hypothetical protein
MILWWAAVKWRLQPILVKLCTVPSVLFLISESEERANNNQNQNTGTSMRGAEASTSSERNKCTGNPQLFMGWNGEPKTRSVSL